MQGTRKHPASVMAGLVFVAAVTVGWGPGRETTASPQPVTAAMFHRLPGADVLFTAHVLGHQPARSPVDCGRLCARDARCLVFTFLPGTDDPQGSCRTHGWLQTPQGLKQSSLQAENQSAPGARSYLLVRDVWLETRCSVTGHCGKHWAACFSGQCLCGKGMFFDYTLNACVQNCTTSLGSTYLEYRQMDLNGYEQYTISADRGNIAKCKFRCNADPLCLTFAYYTPSDGCYFKYITPQDYPLQWRVSQDVTFYQRTCY